MKKIIALSVCVIMLSALCSCGSKGETDTRETGVFSGSSAGPSSAVSQSSAGAESTYDVTTAPVAAQTAAATAAGGAVPAAAVPAAGAQTASGTNGIDPVTVYDAVFPESEMQLMVDNGMTPAMSVSWYQTEGQDLTSLTYTGDDIVLYFLLSNGRRDMPVYLYVSLDGVMQDFNVEYDGTSYRSADHQYVYFPANTDKTVRLRFKPNFGRAGETHYLTVSEMFNPLFVASDYHTGYSDHIFTYGAGGVPVYMQVDAPEQRQAVNDSYDNVTTAPLSSIISKNFGVKNITDSLCPVLCTDLDTTFDDGFQKTRLEVASSQSTPLSLYLGGKAGNYRICVYVNNELQPVFDGYCYSDFTVSTGMQTQVNFTIDTSALSGFNKIYFMYKDMTDPDKSFYITPLIYPLVVS